jgi:hypothetical protein
VNAPQMPPHWQGMMWGTLPFGSSLLAILVVLIPSGKRKPIEVEAEVPQDDYVSGRLVS